MQAWPVQDAKARFSEFLDACIAGAPQMVTKRGAEAAVLVPVDVWRRMQANARPSLKQLLLASDAPTELPTPVRGQIRRRPGRDMYLSAVTVGEIQAGVEITRAQDSAKAVLIEQWLDQVADSFNVIPMDAAIFRVWAQLMHKTSDTLLEDAMIAATAKVHKLVVVTRNVANFKSFGVDLFNPFNPE